MSTEAQPRTDRYEVLAKENDPGRIVAHLEAGDPTEENLETGRHALRSSDPDRGSPPRP